MTFRQERLTVAHRRLHSLATVAYRWSGTDPGEWVADDREYRHLDWVMCTHRLSDADCDDIVEVCRTCDVETPLVVGQERLPTLRQGIGRKVLPTKASQWIFDLLTAVVVEANRQHFEFSLTGFTKPPQYVEYVPGNGEFGWHNDYSHENDVAGRKITAIIQLSDPSEYAGGGLQVFGHDLVDLPRERGSIFVLPSFVFHRITPVTSGLRRALVAWMAGPRLV